MKMKKKKKNKNEKRGDAVSCPQVPVVRRGYNFVLQLQSSLYSIARKKIRVAPGKKQCTWAPSYTTTHRDKM
jgi:hypothetical protein